MTNVLFGGFNRNPPEIPFERGNIRENLPAVKQILKDSIAASSQFKGQIAFDELKAVENNYGSGFNVEEGYYQITADWELPDGDVVKIKNKDGKRVFWYPAQAESLEALFDNLYRIIFDRAMHKIVYAKEEMPGPGEETFANQSTEIQKTVFEDWSKFRFIDLGCGDGRATLIAAIFGLPAIGLDNNGRMRDIAEQNIASAQQKKIPMARAVIKEGNFLEYKAIDDLTRDDGTRLPALFYMYAHSLTGKILATLKPILKEGDFILMHKVTANDHPEFVKSMDGCLKKEYEIAPAQTDAVNIYSINKKM